MRQTYSTPLPFIYSIIIFKTSSIYNIYICETIFILQQQFVHKYIVKPQPTTIYYTVSQYLLSIYFHHHRHYHHHGTHKTMNNMNSRGSMLSSSKRAPLFKSHQTKNQKKKKTYNSKTLYRLCRFRVCVYKILLVCKYHILSLHYIVGLCWIIFKDFMICFRKVLNLFYSLKLSVLFNNIFGCFCNKIRLNTLVS